jgi:hypothetical protein
MRSLLILSLALLIVCLAPQAWGHEDEAEGPLAQRWAVLFADHDTQPGPSAKAPTSPFFQTTLTSTFALHRGVSSRLRDLSPETDRPRTRALVATTTWLKGTFVTETEVANSLGGAGWLQNKIPGDTRDDASRRMIRLGLTGTTGALRYGMTYRTAGQAFLNAPDQTGREVWGEWRTGATTFRSAVGQLWNNVAGDPTRSRLEQTYGRVGVAWTRQAWPEFSLTYARNSLASALDPLGVAPQRIRNDTLEGALAYNSLHWNARLASSYARASDVLRGGAESTVRMQVFTALFRPLNTLTIAPTLTYRNELQPYSGIQIDTPSAAVALQYKQSQRLMITALGNYSSTRSSDGLIDTENIGGRGVLTWDVHETEGWATLLAFEAGYNHLTNRATPSADTQDISGLVRIVLAAL